VKASFGPDAGPGKTSPFGRNDKFLECCHFEERSDEKSYTGLVKISPFGRNDSTSSGKISPFGRNDNCLECCHFEEPRLGRGKLRDEKSHNGPGKISPFGRNDITGSGKISPFGRNDKFLECCHFEERSDEKSYTGLVKISPVGRNDNEPLQQRRWVESMDTVEP